MGEFRDENLRFRYEMDEFSPEMLCLSKKASKFESKSSLVQKKAEMAENLQTSSVRLRNDDF